MSTGSGRRIAGVAVVVIALAAAPACTVEPVEPDNAPRATVDTAFLEDLNREAEQQMEEMLRQNEELFGTGDEPLRGLAP